MCSIFTFFKPKSVFAIPLALLFLGVICQGQPCQDYTCDSLVVRKILDVNGLTDAVSSFSEKGFSGRIDFIEISFKKIKIIPPEIGNLSGLITLYLSSSQLKGLPGKITLINPIYFFLDENNLCNVSGSVSECINSHQTLKNDWGGKYPSWDTTQYSDSAHRIKCDVDFTTSLAPRLFFIDKGRTILVLPNPLNQSTKIHVFLSPHSNTTISIFKPEGQLINTLYSGTSTTGNGSTTWGGKDNQGRNVATGTYLV